MTPDRDEVLARIGRARERLGKEVLILAHFYQNDDIVRFADFVGDSLQLARMASAHKDARYIVFCSVSFMAETARILCAPDQEVLLPEPASRCPLADMAALGQVEAAWDALKSFHKTIIPVVYVNSNADLKAFCARNGGMVCTSSNVNKVFHHILSQDKSLFFFPDGNMGQNVCRDMGVDMDGIALWDQERGVAALGKSNPADARVFLWEGFCIVHRVMGVHDIEDVRKRHDGVKVVVHPECTPEVYGLADFAGSTSFIRNKVETAEPGTKWAIGTEWNFVNRIAAENPDKLVIPLREERCREMAKTTPRKLLHILEGLVAGKRFNRVEVDPELGREAEVALKRMLDLG